MAEILVPATIDREALRCQVQDKYSHVASEPEAGYHFHTGRTLASMLGYDPEDVAWLPAGTVDSFAGTGNPLAMGEVRPGESVVDVGCGAGFDTLLAARAVGPAGQVIAVDMTRAMLDKAAESARHLGLTNIDFRLGFAEDLPVEDASADVVISNGIINLCPDKLAVLAEMARVLRPGGRLQIADIVVGRPVPQEAKEDIDLWSG
jgi:arsenite methyltransferase